jgi:hypothetical protein
MATRKGSKTTTSTARVSAVPRRAVFLITLAWAVPLLLLLINAQFKIYLVQHQTYLAWRAALIFVLLGLSVWGLLRSFDLLKAHAGEPWYTDPLLVGLVLFWGLFPPMWFFVEYLSFDRGSFALPMRILEDIRTAENASNLPLAEKLKADFLARTKLYADMASKVWLAVGAALGAVIGLTKR